MVRSIIVVIVMIVSAAQLACSSDDKPSGTSRPTATSTSSFASSASTTANPTPGPGSQGEPSLPPGVPVLVAGDGRAATGLRAEGSCSEVLLRTPLARLMWTAAASPGIEQRVAVSLAPDGLEREAFAVSDPLSATEESLAWDDVEPGINQYWWVLTRHDEGYVPSETAVFTGQTCEADNSQ